MNDNLLSNGGGGVTGTSIGNSSKGLKGMTYGTPDLGTKAKFAAAGLNNDYTFKVNGV